MGKKKYFFADMSMHSKKGLVNYFFDFFSFDLYFGLKDLFKINFFIFFASSFFLFVCGLIFPSLFLVFSLVGLLFFIKGFNHYKIHLLKKDFEENGIF